MTGKGWPTVNGERPQRQNDADQLTARMHSLNARMESMVDTDGALLPGISESEWQRVNKELDAVLVRLLPLIRAAEERAQVKRINGLLQHQHGRGGQLMKLPGADRYTLDDDSYTADNLTDLEDELRNELGLNPE
jgi:hypothetical protein